MESKLKSSCPSDATPCSPSSLTLETDSLLVKIARSQNTPEDDYEEISNHACKLERERDTARAAAKYAEREIEAWKEKARYWQSLCTLYADERNELREAVQNLRDVKGRHHTELAARALYALLPENV